MTMKNVFYILLALAALLVSAESIIELHPHFHFEEVRGFYGMMALGSYFFVVIALKFWRLLVKRPPNFYTQSSQKDETL